MGSQVSHQPVEAYKYFVSKFIPTGQGAERRAVVEAYNYFVSKFMLVGYMVLLTKGLINSKSNPFALC